MSADLFAHAQARDDGAPAPSVSVAPVLDAEAMLRALAEKRCGVCGSPASFGFASSMRRGRLGRWYCGAHVQEGRAR